MIRKIPLLIFSVLSLTSFYACAEIIKDEVENSKSKIIEKHNESSAFSRCEYDDEKDIMVVERIEPLGPYQIGDYIALYKDKVIGINSPTNNLKFPEGLTKGDYVEEFGEERFFKLCGENFEVFPHLELAEANNPTIDVEVTTPIEINQNNEKE